MTDATDKREKAMIAKYGSKEALAAKRREWQKKSRLKYKGTGGFAALSPERRKEISRKAHEARWGNKGENQ